MTITLKMTIYFDKEIYYVRPAPSTKDKLFLFHPISQLFNFLKLRVQ